MSFRALKHNLHDSFLTAFKIGPRRELSLTIDLNPVVVSGGGTLSVRFGGIRNLEVVDEFFKSIERMSFPAYLDEVVSIVFLEKISGGGGMKWLLHLARTGELVIECQHVTES